MTECELSLIPEGLVVKSPYKRGFVDELKTTIPRLDRVWNSKKSPLVRGAPMDVWIVNPKHAIAVQRMIARHYRENVGIPAMQSQAAPEVVNRIFRLRYVGAVSLRDDGSKSATGLVADQWVLIFPESVLKEWFEGGGKSNRPSTSDTLFAVLGLSSSTNDVDEIKTAYRRMAKHWHPDVCHEPDATKIFQRINEAYNTLSDPKKLKLYTAGLSFSTHKQQNIAGRTRRQLYSTEYRPPLRCGMVKCKGIYQMGRFLVEEIVAWDDIADDIGRTLSTEFNIHGSSIATQVIEHWR